MGAGKSLDLLKTAYNYEERNKKVTLLTSDLDKRNGIKKISSRVGISRESYIFDKTTNIYDFFIKECEGSICLLIDESQFLTKEQVWQLTDIVDKLNVTVIAYGLRSDFRGEPFEGSIFLMTWADKIEELKTVCEYGDKASMNMRLNDGKPIFDGEQVMIGGNDTYLPVCRKYYKKKKEEWFN
jgi:thymidine kinase|tara:strand:+ start:3718 stop:4266 length:549 start_codon:yes stop_codon:yes gene_type:complete